MPKLLKRFRQSVLSAAVSGELTREWRGGGDVEWEKITVGDGISTLRNGLAIKPDDNSGGTPILKISSVRPFSVKTEQGRFVSVSEQERRTFDLRLDDVLVTRYNGSLELVGVAGRVKNPELANFTYPDKLMRVRTKSSLLPAYLEVLLGSPASRVIIEAAAKTTSGQTGISGQNLKELLLSCPPLPEQAEIVRRVEALFAIADRLEARHKAAATHFQRLTPALLAKAFRGELVEQDPADEPASVLLERIRAQRAAAGEGAKAGGRGRRPKVSTPEAERGAAVEEQEPSPEQRRGRGRPCKVTAEAGQTSRGIPLAASAEAAIRLLQERARAKREGKQAVQARLFGGE